MPRPSSIDRLPPDILEQFQALLRDPRITQLQATAEINAILEREGHPERLTKSSVNRYSMRMEKVGERLRQSREVAQMWIAKLGAKPQGQVGNLVTEMLRALSFDLALKLQETEIDAESLPGVIEMARELSLTATRLEKATSENVKREAEIRKQEREKAAEELTAAVEKNGAQPITPERFRELVREVYGG